MGPTTPTPQGGRFGLGPVRSPLLRASQLISLPPGTEMFQFPGFASRSLAARAMTGLAPRRVSPFGHPGINACVPLPLAYRSLPRPSSPPCAQASPTCLRSLDRNSLCYRQPSQARANYFVSVTCLHASDDDSLPTITTNFPLSNSRLEVAFCDSLRL